MSCRAFRGALISLRTPEALRTPASAPPSVLTKAEKQEQEAAVGESPSGIPGGAVCKAMHLRSGVPDHCVTHRGTGPRPVLKGHRG